MIRAALLISALLAATTVSAAGKDNSAIVPYPVKGKTQREIYDFIKTHAPRIAPNATFAFTAIATKTVKSHKVDGAGCRYQRFETSAIYNFVLPRHEDEGKLKTAVAKQWRGFVEYLRVHEEGHREMWRACFADYDAKALELSSKDCTALDAKREALFTRIKKRCVQQDEAFDVTFRKEVLKEPFVAAALKAPATSRKE